VLAQQPSLQFISAQDFAYGQVIGANVSELRSTPSQTSSLADDYLMGIN
jgi:hypothetical protein